MQREGSRRAFGRGGGLLPSQLANLAAWYQFGQGITSVANAVSQWKDQSGNGRHLAQGAGVGQPTKQADGSILFDGVNHVMAVTGGFTFSQPVTIYLRFRQVTWTNGRRILDGNTSNTGAIIQEAVTPAFDIFAGNTAGSNTNLAVNVYSSVAIVFNGASSVTQVDLTAAVTGNAGASNMAGFTLGASGAGTAFGNIQVKEIILYAAAHNAATRAQVIAYLATL